MDGGYDPLDVHLSLIHIWLGSTLMADHIFVLSDGKIAEQGSHQKLMKLQGIYADMYNRQRRWYQDEIS